METYSSYMPIKLVYKRIENNELYRILMNVLHFGELYATANNSIYSFLNAKTIHIPSISVTGRTDVNRDGMDGVFSRNVDDAFEDKTMQFYREWSTSLDPADVKFICVA